MKVIAATVAIFISAIVATAQTTTGSSDAEIQGPQLAKQLCETAPAENFTNTGILEIRNSRDKTTKIPVTFETAVTGDHWQCSYSTHGINTNEDHQAWMTLMVTHFGDAQNRYHLYKVFLDADKFPAVNADLSGEQIMIPFAGSDFWICDLGLDFFHWPDQKIIKKEFMRGRGCMVLESTNPNPTPAGYSRVDSWIDEETLGIVHAEAYDTNGKLLKIFDPKSFKKVGGQWELQDMEIRNVQTGSRTRIEFDLKAD